MTRRAFLKQYAWRFAAALIPLLLIVYTVYNLLGSSSDRLMTTPARRMTDLRLVSGQGYLFRDEEVLTVASPGVIMDLAACGAKVSRGSDVATVYDGYADEERETVQLELDRINRMLSVLEASRVPTGTTLSDAEALRAGAQAAYLELRQAVIDGKWSQTPDLEDELLTLLGRYERLTADAEGAETLYAELKERRSALLRGTGSTLKCETSSGYYYSRDRVDGYETLFGTAALEGLTLEGFAELTQDAAPPGEGFAVGKLVYGNRWYLVLQLQAEEGQALAVGETYPFSFPENNGKVLELTCTELTVEEGGTLAVFASDEVPSDFVYLRSQPVEITVGTTTGYYVPEAAMRVENGVEGVYIFEIGTVYFRRVEVLYRGDGYCMVAEQGDRGSEYLALNDMMVTSGEELYDGRVFQ